MTYTLHNALCDAALKMLSEKENVFKMYYEDGKSVRQIAEFYDTGNGVVQYFFKVHGKQLFNQHGKRGRVRNHNRTKHVHDDIDTIVDMYLNQEMTTIQIAEKYGVVSDTIGKILRSRGIHAGDHRRKCGYTHKTKHVWNSHDKVVSMYKGGMTLSDIGNVFNVTHSTVRKVLIKHGVDIRSTRNINAKNPLQPNFHISDKCKNVFDNAESIFEKYIDQRMTYEQLANEYEVSTGTIFKAIKSVREKKQR